MQCRHFDAGACRSCALLETPRPDQLSAKQALAERAVGHAGGVEWAAPYAGPDAGFRTKAKMVVAGTADAPTLGILDEDSAGVDLRDCQLHDPRIEAALPALAEFVTLARLTPYDVPSRSGELKHVLVTVSPEGELMVRWVLRSTEALPRLRKHLPWLAERLPSLAVASANLLPEHKAVLEGDQEVLLTDRARLPMRLTAATVLLGPRAFFQTNTAVADALYREVAAWVDEAAPATVWDLYCGVGGFALHVARPGRAVVGVESSEAAVEAARAGALASGLPAGSADFLAADAVAWAVGRPTPDLVIVNPPRRGIGAALAGWLETSGVRHVVYSSCNPATLAQDLAAMPSLRPVRARVFDMFPHTAHVEVAVLLERREAQGA